MIMSRPKLHHTGLFTFVGKVLWPCQRLRFVFIFLADVSVCFKPSGFDTFFLQVHVCNIAFCVPLKN